MLKAALVAFALAATAVDAGLGLGATDPEACDPRGQRLGIGQPYAGVVATHTYRLQLRLPDFSPYELGAVGVVRFPGLVGLDLDDPDRATITVRPATAGRRTVTARFTLTGDNGPVCSGTASAPLVVRQAQRKRSTVHRNDRTQPYTLRLELFERAGLDYDASELAVGIAMTQGSPTIPKTRPQTLLRYAVSRPEEVGGIPRLPHVHRRVGPYAIAVGPPFGGASSALLSLDVTAPRLRDGQRFVGALTLEVRQRGRVVAGFATGLDCRGVGTLVPVQACTYPGYRSRG